MSLMELFASVGVKNAHFIDDAFDLAPTKGLAQEDVQHFIDRIDLPALERIGELTGIADITDADAIEALQVLEHTHSIFNSRAEFGEAGEVLFSDFFTDRSGKKSDLEILIDFLKKSGVESERFGVDSYHDCKSEPQLVFIDLRLRENGDPITTADAVEVYKKTREMYPTCKPFVFLMSTLTTPLRNFRESFFLEAQIFASQFEAISKQNFRDEDEMQAVFTNYIRFLPELHRLHDRIGFIEGAIRKAAVNVGNTLRSLDLPDYFVLHHNTAAIEKVGLGTYISDLLLEYLVNEVESSPELWNLAAELDGWKLQKLPRSRFGLTYAAGKIYSGNILHSNFRLESEAARGLGPKDGYFYLGDVFFLKDEYASGSPKKAYVIATPACDLVRPEKLKERTIFVCEGRVKKVTLATTPTGDGGIPTTIISSPNDTLKQFSIDWNKKRLHTWHVEEMSAFEKDESDYVRVGRLRPLYAIQLQHAITADLSRIGVQRAPNMLQPMGIGVCVSNGVKWVAVDNDDVNEPCAAAVADTEDGKQALYIISDATVRRIRKKIKAWLDRNSTFPSAVTLRKIVESEAFEEKLMYMIHTRAEGVAPEDDIVRPMAGVDGISEEECAKMVLVRPNSTTAYAKVNGGRDVSPEQEAVLVISLFKSK
ncbi:hypothetical protein ALO95_01730 [Pseudomonas syringae pv. antirrhini]|uniref:Uncharacterized protein n=1 Tax=Pseudomonas syringae pv. antirrhini TaxID=251702 RepID=A0A0P9NMD4_9PSED|nr:MULTISPECIES: hypothetical protein [Pseudomonas]KPW44800.1 Uncharacterized protein ALO88_03838 [Pseudomonas syringae pv. antirrhini]RMW30359.1 hypothetical protein ALO95_01730 [Pseudomonas syringae pv. antirrhini]WIN05793.1 hypothetical protein QQF68_19650 [Pseudomonas syringae pv. antirrhini str. 126]